MSNMERLAEHSRADNARVIEWIATPRSGRLRHFVSFRVSPGQSDGDPSWVGFGQRSSWMAMSWSAAVRQSAQMNVSSSVRKERRRRARRQTTQASARSDTTPSLRVARVWVIERRGWVPNKGRPDRWWPAVVAVRFGSRSPMVNGGR